jgi:DNA polymerase
MDVFADPTQDPYCEMASRIFGRSVTKADEQLRFIGKNTVLGCGYSMSANKFAAMAKLQGVDLASAGTTAEECVDAYREAYPRIAGVRRGGFWQGGLWRAVGEAAYNAIDRGGSSEAGKCQFSKEGASLSIRLPSGRRLTYRGVRIEERVPGYCAMLGLPARPKKTIIYDHHHGYPKALYGGLLVENICQAICRDLLAGAMVRLNERIVLHVHDEIVIEGGDLKTLVETMSSPPDWAKGFTIVVEGFNSPVYGKSPPVGVRKLVARNGRVQ